MAKRTAPKPAEPAIPKEIARLVPASREEAELLLSKLGTVQRRIAGLEMVRDQEIAEVYARSRQTIEDSEREAEHLLEALHVWAENNRLELTKDGKQKTATLSTGKVGWRKMPDSVVIVNEDEVLKRIEDAGPELYNEFVRISKSLDKQRMLTLRDKAEAIKGVTIRAGVEKFEAKPNPFNPKEV